MATDVDIETWSGLGPEAGPDGLRSTLGHPAFDGAVICTHGRAAAAVAPHAAAPHRGRTAAQLHGRHLLAKGSAWILTIDADGTVSGFDHIAAGS